MALTVINNGDPGTPSNINQYHDLLTGVMTDQAVTLGNNLSVKGSVSLDNGNITTDGAGNLTVKSISTGGGNLTVNTVYATTLNGALGGGITSSDDNTNQTTGINTQRPGTPRSLLFQSWDGTNAHNAFSIGSNGFKAPAYVDDNGNYHGGNFNNMGMGGNFIQSTLGWFGVKGNTGTKLFEGRSDGTFVIGSHTFYSSDNGTVSWASAGPSQMDTFDVAEVYPVAEKFPNGTVVCPDAQMVMHRCTHDACPHAVVVSYKPGLAIGHLEEDATHAQYMALVGRVRVVTQQTVAHGAWVVSDGNGGVRPLAEGEHGVALGYALGATADDGMVGIFVRPVYR